MGMAQTIVVLFENFFPTMLLKSLRAIGENMSSILIDV
jgi:hypothetical protein